MNEGHAGQRAVFICGNQQVHVTYNLVGNEGRRDAEREMSEGERRSGERVSTHIN